MARRISILVCALACGSGCSLLTGFSDFTFKSVDGGKSDSGLCPMSSLPCHTACIPDGVLLCNDGVYGECQPKPGTRYLCDDAGRVIDAGPSDVDADVDAGLAPDADSGMPLVDSGTPDVDAGRDAGMDSGSTDGGRPDTGTDAGTDGGTDSGYDVGRSDAGRDADVDAGTTPGCPLGPISADCVVRIRVTYGSPIDMRPEVTGYFIRRIRDDGPEGGPDFDTGWLGTECYGGVRWIGPRPAYTTECWVHWTPIGGTIVRFYVTVGGSIVSACSSTSCEFYPSGIQVWILGVEKTPAEIMLNMQREASTPSGMNLMTVQFITN